MTQTPIQKPAPQGFPLLYGNCFGLLLSEY